MAQRPGGEYASRPLQMIWLLDCSGSMAESGKIEALNNAIREVIPAIRAAAEGNPEVQFFLRAIRFSSGASWHVPTPTPVSEFRWTDLNAGGETDLGQALALLAEELRTLPQNARLLPPQVVLISDGKPTDDWRGGLQALLDTPWGKRSIRQAIAIGHDADQETLKRFIDNPERDVLRADNAEQLVKYFRYVSTSVASAVPGKPSAPPAAPVPDPQDAFDSTW